jgi:hypothetical protein
MLRKFQCKGLALTTDELDMSKEAVEEISVQEVGIDN